MTPAKSEQDAGMISMIVCVYEIRHENEFDMNKRGALLLQPCMELFLFSRQIFFFTIKCRLT